MIKLYKFLFIICFVLCFVNLGIAQNEFYNNGSIVYLNSGNASATPTLFINGNLINQDGAFTNNASFLELKGNITNNPITYHYSSTGTERFSGSVDQIISGTWNGTTSNQDQFYDFKINKTAASGENIIFDNALTGNIVNINSAGSLTFENSNGIIRTQTASSGTSRSTATGNYTNTLFLQNPDPTKFNGYSWTIVPIFGKTGGAQTKYIEGKLKLAVSSNNSYKFPIGVVKNYLDGMEGVSVDFTGTFTTTAVTAYIQPAGIPAFTSDLITNGDILFYDIGSLPDVTPNNQFNNCVGSPDGHDDVAIIDQAVTHEWILTPDATTSDYDLSVHPGPVLDNISWVNMGPACQTIATTVKYLARNGIIGGNEAVGPTINYWNPGILGLYQKPNGNALTAQNGWSRFRTFGTSLESNTSLPVELTKFYLKPVNNEYFDLSWETVSELNNAGFYVQRSSNGSSFQKVGWVAGNGTSSSIHNYSFEDHNVVPNIIYYYRLMQLDNNQTLKYSNILSGELNATDFSVFNILPNPTTINPEATVFVQDNGIMILSIYDILGQNIRSKSYFLNKGNNKIEINLSDLASATYLVKFNYNENVLTKKIIKN